MLKTTGVFKPVIVVVFLNSNCFQRHDIDQLKGQSWGEKKIIKNGNKKTHTKLKNFVGIYVQHHYLLLLQTKNVSLHGQHPFNSALLRFQKAGFCCFCPVTYTKAGTSNKRHAWPCMSMVKRWELPHRQVSITAALEKMELCCVTLLWVLKLGGCSFHVLMFSHWGCYEAVKKITNIVKHVLVTCC